jgi:dolichyl-phosphate-mannose-protein mannosyltransferase
MASPAQTTGVDGRVDELRRRNVAGQPAAGAPAVAQALTIEKSKEKVRNAYEIRAQGSKPAAALDGELTSSQPFSALAALDEYEWIWAPLIFTALAIFTRMWKIGLSPIVTWDEAQYAIPLSIDSI